MNIVNKVDLEGAGVKLKPEFGEYCDDNDLTVIVTKRMGSQFSDLDRFQATIEGRKEKGCGSTQDAAIRNLAESMGYVHTF